nr:hypothetical protein [Brevifollis gellanilyticus]
MADEGIVVGGLSGHNDAAEGPEMKVVKDEVDASSEMNAQEVKVQREGRVRVCICLGEAVHKSTRFELVDGMVSDTVEVADENRGLAGLNIFKSLRQLIPLDVTLTTKLKRQSGQISKRPEMKRVQMQVGNLHLAVMMESLCKHESIDATQRSLETCAFQRQPGHQPQARGEIAVRIVV